MRLLQYTIIIWIGCVRAGEQEPIHFEPYEPPPMGRHNPSIGPSEPLRPSHPIIEPLKPIHPIEPIHGDPILVDPMFPRLHYRNSSQVVGVQGSVVDKGPSGVLPVPVSVPRSVQTYLSQHSQISESLSGIELPQGVGRTVQQIRAQYLEQIQKSFDQEGLITIPKVVLNSGSSFIQKGINPSLVEWMVAITDGPSFAEYLSQLPTASDAQREQFLFSPEKKEIYSNARAAVLRSAQALFDMVTSLHQHYADFFVVGQGVIREFTEQEAEELSSAIDKLNDLLEASVEQHHHMITLLSEQSPLFTEAMISSVVDKDHVLAVWKMNERIVKQSNPQEFFASYEAFLNGFQYATNIKKYIQRFIGPEDGQFISVQALVAALDKIGFILEEKSSLLPFRHQVYSKGAIDRILSSLVKEYSDVFIPSKKFVFQYGTAHHLFKPISFFIPNYDQFLIDAKVLTIEELAKKYGQESDSIKNLLNNVYEAMYVLQQTNQNKQAGELGGIVNKIMMEYPDIVPDLVTKLVSSEGIPVQTLFDAQVGLEKMSEELKNELVLLQTKQFKKSLTYVSAAINRAQEFIQQSLSKAESFLTDKITDRAGTALKESSLGVMVNGVLKKLQDTESMVVVLTRVKEDMLKRSSALSGQYQEVLDQLNAFKEKTMSFAVRVEYGKAKAQQDRKGIRFMDTFQNTIKNELLSYTQNYFTNVLFENLSPEGDGSMEGDGGGNQTDNSITQLAMKSALEKQNESDYEACIWASNKMGMMESKITSILTFLKIKKTPLLLAGYKNALKDLEADFLFLSSSQSIQKCLNVIANRSFLLQKIQLLKTEIKALQKELDDEQKTKAGS